MRFPPIRAFRPTPETEDAWRARLAKIRRTQAFGEASKVLRAAGEPDYFKAAEIAAGGMES